MLSVTKSLQRLATLEILGVSESNNRSQSEEEKMALAQFTENITYDEQEKRYAISWP